MKKRNKKKYIQFAIFSEEVDDKAILSTVGAHIFNRCFPHECSCYNDRYSERMTRGVQSLGLVVLSDADVLLTEKFRMWCRGICPHYYDRMYRE